MAEGRPSGSFRVRDGQDATTVAHDREGFRTRCPHAMAATRVPTRKAWSSGSESIGATAAAFASSSDTGGTGGAAFIPRSQTAALQRKSHLLAGG